MTNYLGDIAKVGKRKLVLGPMTDEIMTVTEQVRDIAISPINIS